MARTYTVCNHPQVSEIDQALVGSEAYRSIAKRFEASESAMYRHQQDHLPALLVKAKGAAELVSADNLMEKVRELETEARRIAKKAEDAGDLRVAMSGIRERGRIVELMAKLTGRFDSDRSESTNRPIVNLHFPTMSAEDLAKVENAQVIDLPPTMKRLLERPSDGMPR